MPPARRPPRPAAADSPTPPGGVVELDPRSPRAILAAFRARLAAGEEPRPVGRAKRAPRLLLEPALLPRFGFELFEHRFDVSGFLFEEGLDFFVAWVAPPARGTRRRLHPRIFYKDSTLLWRVASHVIRTDGEDWIGKGDVKWERENGVEYLVSDEDSTNLPYEMQGALDAASHGSRKRRHDEAVALVLQNAPPRRLRPYAEFSVPRRRAKPLFGGRPIARLRRRGDPSSLWFAEGFAPDFDRPLARELSTSRLYGGEVEKLRFLSANGRVQYQLVVTPSHAWINPPQAMTRELTSFGLRALHVPADDAIFLPGYEYCFLDEGQDPPCWHSQIPEGFAGEPSPLDPRRRDASAWIEALPVIAEFRRRVLDPRRGARRRDARRR